MTKEQFEPPLHFENWLKREETSIVEKYYSSMAWQRMDYLPFAEMLHQRYLIGKGA